MVDQAVRSLFEPFARSGRAVLATGGFGSFDLTPGSDVDLLFVHAPGDRTVEESVSAILYPLWDAGLRVSHAVRTPQECEAESEQRLESLTAMATARLIDGDSDLAGQACARSLAVARRQGSAFVRALRTSRAERGRRFGHIAHLLEPDLKESLGGVRDHQLSTWLRWAFPEIGPAGSPPSGSLVDVRLALHALNGAASNRLLAEHHQGVAGLLGLEDQRDWESRDLVMRRVADVGRVTDRWAERLLDAGSAGLEGGAAAVARASETEDPLAWATAPVLGGRWAPDFTARFLRLLGDREGIERAFDEPGSLLTRILPEWNDVRGRPQRDPYHRYPVDVHLLRTVKEAARLLQDPGEPFASQAVEAVADRDALLLGALLHDIGKVGSGSHVPLGVDISARVLDRMGMSDSRREDVLFLVREHLLLSDSATRRNIEDEDLVLRVAARVGTSERLGMLYLLTVADATATGPTACTPWRMGLIRDLVSKVSTALERALVDEGRAHRVERAEATVRAALADRSPQDVDAFLRSIPSAYLLWARPSDVAVHFELMKDRPHPDEIRSTVRPGRSAGTHLVTVVALDRLGLLADVAGTLSVSGLSILAAHAFTSDRGVALDEFEVRGAFEPDVPEERWERFRSVLQHSFAGDDLGQRIRSLRSHYGKAAARVPVHVRVDQDASQFSTVVEVEGPDRIGLLFELTHSLASLGLDVHLAKVATYGARVVDVFYVTDGAGQKLAEPEQLAALERALIEAASV
jgi:[protein-PII] uridylyltransferase